ncbi:radical SAM protein [candidate division KSB1 bacterium]
MIYQNFLYDEPLFRPPSEARSLILQPTIGCSWNNCAFCEMYTSKKFRIKPEEELLNEIETYSKTIPKPRKVFLADGNAMVLASSKLMKIIEKINETFQGTPRISAYALPKDILSKSIKELKTLNNAGLKLLYIGIESGDDEVLTLVNKGETSDSTIQGLVKVREAGIKLSVMILTGLGGKKYHEQHAINSAKILNAIQPEYTSTLILSFPFGIERYKQRFKGEYIPMNPADLLMEMRIFLEHTQLDGSIFRSDHASNYIILKGILSRDKKQLIEKIDFALQHPDLANLREDWQRGL